MLNLPSDLYCYISIAKHIVLVCHDDDQVKAKLNSILDTNAFLQRVAHQAVDRGYSLFLE